MNILFNSKALFKDKLVFLKNPTFILGGDTLIRVLDLKYYKDQEELDSDLTMYKNKGCHFHTFPRYDPKYKEYLTLK